MKMSEEEIQKSHIYGCRAGVIGIAFNEMSYKYYHEVVKRIKEYIIENAHWSSIHKFVDKTFNRLFKIYL